MKKLFKKSAIVFLISGLVLSSLISLFISRHSFVQAGLSITSPSSAVFATSTVLTTGQTSTTTISYVEVQDTGTAGWDATIQLTHFTLIGSVYVVAGVNDTLTTEGTYDGTYGVTNPAARYEIKITKSGAVGTSEWKWRYSTTSASAWSATSLTGVALAVEKGIEITFSTADYAVDDEWHFSVDVFPYAELYITPGNITVVSGDTGVTKGAAGYLAGAGATSDAMTIMTGEPENSAGTFQQDQDLDLTVHANSLKGEFKTTAIFTVL